MNKNLFLLGMAVAALTSCSENEVLDVAPGVETNGAISFQNFVNNSTRSITDGNATSNSLLEFSVWGGSQKSEDLFDGEKVYRTSTSDNWKYDEIKYWMPGSTYKFAAYAPINSNVVPVWNYADGVIGFTATVANEKQYDLVYDVLDNSISIPDPIVPTDLKTVEFSLNHILSKVQLCFKKGADLGKNTKLVIDNISLAGKSGNEIKDKGTYNGGSTVTWNISGDAGNVTFANNTTTYEVTDEADNQIAGQAFYVIPQTIAQGITVKFDVILYENAAESDDEAPNWVKVGEKMTLSSGVNTSITWGAGNVYSYTATIEQKNIDGSYPIEFSATVSDNWTTNPETGLSGLEGDVAID